MGQTPGPLVRALLLSALNNPLVFCSYWLLYWYCLWRGVWCFCPDRNLINWWHCDVGSVSTNRIWVQRWLTHRNILAPKVLIFPLSFKIIFVAVVLFWPCPAHSSGCSFSKKMTRHRPVGTIHGNSDSGSRGTKGPVFIRCVDSQDPQIYEIWCLSSDGVTRESHHTSQVDVGAETVGQFSSYFLSENGRIIPILGQSSINGSVELLSIPIFFSGPMFTENLLAPYDTTGWGDSGNTNQKWPVIPGGNLQQCFCPVACCYTCLSWLHAQESGS